MKMNRFYDACFGLNIGACVACLFGAQYIPALAGAAVWFAMSAAFFRIVVWARKRSGVET